MSYSIIFETKIVKLSDGRIIHFDRSGCNNDTSGRRKDDFSAEIFTIDEFIKKAEKYKKNSKPYKENPADWQLKIGNRYATYYDYGEHLLRMFKRAISYEEFIKSFCFRVEHLTGIQLYEPEEKLMTVDEFDKVFYDLLYSGKGMSYRRIIEFPDIVNEENLISLIEAGEYLSFEIKRW